MPLFHYEWFGEFGSGCEVSDFPSINEALESAEGRLPDKRNCDDIYEFDAEPYDPESCDCYTNEEHKTKIGFAIPTIIMSGFCRHKDWGNCGNLPDNCTKEKCPLINTGSHLESEPSKL
jgi:hypothetical protein